MPLFMWATRQLESHSAKARLVMLHNYRNADGEPMTGLILPGKRVPVVFQSMTAALDAQRRAEGWA